VDTAVLVGASSQEGRARWQHPSTAAYVCKAPSRAGASPRGPVRPAKRRGRRRMGKRRHWPAAQPAACACPCTCPCTWGSPAGRPGTAVPGAPGGDSLVPHSKVVGQRLVAMHVHQQVAPSLLHPAAHKEHLQQHAPRSARKSTHVCPLVAKPPVRIPHISSTLATLAAGNSGPGQGLRRNGSKWVQGVVALGSKLGGEEHRARMPAEHGLQRPCCRYLVCLLQAASSPTSGLRSMLGLAHSRFRLAPAALVRRWPRQEPSGLMFGTWGSGRGFLSYNI
jgi:hypothetical protein